MVKDATAERCPWCGSDPLYVDYHDNEWGVPVADERALFERLILEGMQAGLSWLTVLRKRQRMKTLFHGFDPERLASCGEEEVNRWLADPGIIRHRGKLTAMTGNARSLLNMNGTFAGFIWSFVDGVPQQNAFSTLSAVPSSTEASRAMARCLKEKGFRFVGPTICYAFMQSAGLVNDHLTSCPGHARCAAFGASWTL